MPSEEVVSKENEVNALVKEPVDTKATSEENGSKPTQTVSSVLNNDGIEEANIPKETKAESEVQIKDKSEGSNGSVESSESENKENEKPFNEDLEIKKKQAEELLLEGKRNLVIRDYQTAVKVLSEACNVFGTVYGEMAEECADVYFTYGCALFELAKIQMNTVGLKEKDDFSNQEDSVTELNVPSENKTNKVEKVNEVEDKSTEKREKSSDDENLVKEDNPDEENNADEVNNSDEDDISEEEDIEEYDDLQLAWEMLELAKVIYKNQNTEESKLKLAKVLMKCGEVSIEDEKFVTAIEDMTESLQIRRYLLPEDSRIIAETLFQLGITQEMYGSSSLAIQSLSEAVAVLQQRIKTLINSSDENFKTEVAEIKTIIPDIQEKIDDINQRKQANVTAFLAVLGTNSKATNGSSSTTEQVSNISHLVRKRPKQDETNGSVSNKVPKLEESSTDAKQ